jgi:Cu/Ag efflux pump CusA
MTSLAFILGVLPLVISTGAGSGAQNAVGTGVMGGMITATVRQYSSFLCSLWCAAALAAEVTMLSTAIRLSNTDSHE